MHKFWCVLWLIALCGCAGSPARQSARQFDVVLRGGTVVDGSGAAGRVADLGIRGERVVAIGDLGATEGDLEIDCSGLVVAPGFIDVHAHVDALVVRHPGCDNYLRMGVTTMITGNCGTSVPGLDRHLKRLENGGIGCNYGSLVGFGTVRREVLGTAERSPTEEEMLRMEQLVDAAMQAGAFGLSTGLIYVPGTYATTEEIARLAAVAGRHGGLYATHMRNENDHVLDSIEEALRIGEVGDLPVHISHIKNSGRGNWGRSAQVVERIERARAEGRRVTADQYAYDASSTSIDILFPSAALSVGRREFGEKLRADRGFRQQMRDSLLATMKRVGFGDLRYARIAAAPGNALLSGLTIQEAAAARGDDSPEAQAELAMDVMADAEGKRVSMVYHTMSEEDVQRYMRQDWIAVAADGGLRLQGEQEKPHPRSCGNNPRVLRRYVRELGVLELAAAVRKMTSLPAEIFSLDDRGVLREGAYADVCVFDPQTVADEATFDQPLLAPTGIHCVLVNGRLAVRAGEVLPRRSGHVLRSGR